MNQLVDTPLEFGLVVVAVLALLWQAFLLLLALSWARSGANSLRIGILPILVAIVAIVALWVIQ